MTSALIISAWLFAGWVGYRLHIWWWTEDLDLTRTDRWLFRALIVLGPVELILALLHCASYGMLSPEGRSRGDDIVVYRKDKA